MREKNIFKLMVWIIREELREIEWKSFALSAVSFLVSMAVFLIIFRR